MPGQIPLNYPNTPCIIITYQHVQNFNLFQVKKNL